MVEGKSERRLSAIMVADVVGYSHLMEADEGGALATLKDRRRGIIEPMVKHHSGRIVKFMGDGVLVEFASAINSVACALAIQKQMAEANETSTNACRIVLRIGLNLGDVVGEGNDIYGNGVNVAARLEALAEPGGICFSGKVYDEIKGKFDLATEDLGDIQLKNISWPVRSYRIKSSPESPNKNSRPLLALPDKPSIAVLPFQNMSGDADQEYFADGVVEEIITGLSRVRWLFVIARNSSFAYKGKAVELRQVGLELGVRYILEGSVRKMSNKVRITAQLIEVATGSHLWADRCDGDLVDVFELQDRVTSSVVAALSAMVEKAEIARARQKPTHSLDAYDLYLRALAGVHLWTRGANEEALALLYRAIERDPLFATAYGLAARCYTQRKSSEWMEDPIAESEEAVRLARKAIELGRDDATALCTAGLTLAFVAGELEDGEASVELALAIDPNSTSAWLFDGWIKAYLGKPDAAIQRIERAMRLSPLDPHLFSMHTALALAKFEAERYEEAMSWINKVGRGRPSMVIPLVLGAAIAHYLGDEYTAKDLIERLKREAPKLRLGGVKDLFPLRRQDDLARLQEGLRKSGLPA